jgi:hypothetical protein
MPAPTGAQAEALKTAWAKAVEITKQRAVNPTLYRALEKTVPIAWEDNFFVVGMLHAEGTMVGAMNTAEYQVAINRAVQEATRDPNVRFRFIEGSDYADWEFVRQRDAAFQAQQSASAQKRAIEFAAGNTWEDVYEQASRLWGNAELRSLPVGRGRYIAAAMDMVSEAMDRLYPKEGKVDEATERGLSRVIDRIASMAQSDSAVIAYLLFEKRKQ